MTRAELKQEVMVEIVKAISRLGTCNRAQVGCLITRQGRIIVTGHNGSPPGWPHCTDVGCLMEDGHCVRTTHAEANAICFAARHGLSIEGCTMWVFGWDGGICHRCHKLALSAGIVQIVIVRKDGTVTEERI